MRWILKRYTCPHHLPAHIGVSLGPSLSTYPAATLPTPGEQGGPEIAGAHTDQVFPGGVARS